MERLAVELWKTNRSGRIQYLGEPSVTVGALQILRGRIKTYINSSPPDGSQNNFGNEQIDVGQYLNVNNAAL